jgi:hypothetical protein
MKNIKLKKDICDAIQKGSEYKEVAKIHGIHWTKVRYIYLDTSRKIYLAGDLYGLNTLTIHTLKRNGIINKNQAMQGINSKTIYAKCFPNFGAISYINLCAFLGIEIVEDKDKKQKNINKQIKYLEKNGYQVTLK